MSPLSAVQLSMPDPSDAEVTVALAGVEEGDPFAGSRRHAAACTTTCSITACTLLTKLRWF